MKVSGSMVQGKVKADSGFWMGYQKKASFVQGIHIEELQHDTRAEISGKIINNFTHQCLVLKNCTTGMYHKTNFFYRRNSGVSRYCIIARLDMSNTTT
mmetsp:Transcript_1913/g.2688  ORF Transcript_1913/g.2688 Transcript_1913/m.2688 type:complete len:98 (+) Transcript_1913:488-781(+)